MEKICIEEIVLFS